MRHWAEERNHAIQLLQRDKRLLSYELRNVRRCRPIAPRLTRHQQQLLNILMRHRVSPEVLQRCAEGGYGRLDTHGNPTGCAFQQPSPTANPPALTANFIPTQVGRRGKPAARTAAYLAQHYLSTARLVLETSKLAMCRELFVNEQCLVPNPHRPGQSTTLSHRMMLDMYQGVFIAVVERVETQPFVAMSVDGWSKDLGSAHCLAWCAAWWGQAYLVDCVNTEANSVTAAYLLSKFDFAPAAGQLNRSSSPRQQASSTEAVRLSPISSPADWVASGPLRSLHACLATPTSTPLQPTVLTSPTATTPSQLGSQPDPVPSVVLSGPPGPLAAALSATMHPQVLGCFLAHLAKQQAIVDGGGGGSTTGLVGQQLGGGSTAGMVGQQLGGGSTTGLVGQQLGGGSTAGMVGQQLGGGSTTGLVGQQLGGGSTTGLVGQQSSHTFASTVLQMYNKRMQYSASAAQYLAALLDPRYRRQSQRVTREQRKLAEQLLIKLATEDGSKGDRPVAEALSQLALWQQPDVVLFSRTSLSAVYFAPQLTTDPVRWWQLHGDFAPELQTVAQRVLCIPATAAANERVFSAFSHVWSDKRASLILGRMWVMAYIYFNKRVLERKPKTLSDADWEEYERWMRKTPQDQS
ncbi:hypothetical protein QJQ45_002753 [Haematococcus lacustris]|nr:hypothetical protein QJQ45_002753 [Haematococcus lacustris]